VPSLVVNSIWRSGLSGSAFSPSFLDLEVSALVVSAWNAKIFRDAPQKLFELIEQEAQEKSTPHAFLLMFVLNLRKTKRAKRFGAKLFD
jgi:hypothetical protein